MRSLTADQLFALRASELEVRHLVTLETGSGTQRYSTQVTSWSSEEFEARLMEPPQVSITPGDPSRGAIGGVRVSMRLANADGRFSAVPSSWYQGRSFTIRDVLPTVTSDALRTLNCVATDASMTAPGEVVINGEDWFSVYRRQSWPSNSYTLTQSAFPSLVPADPVIGRVAPLQIGRCLHPAYWIVDAQTRPELGRGGIFYDYHHFLEGFYSYGAATSRPLVFGAPNGGWSEVASVASVPLFMAVGSSGVGGAWSFVQLGTPVLPSLPYYTRNAGMAYDLTHTDVHTAVDASSAKAVTWFTGLYVPTTEWTPVQVADLMLTHPLFGLVPSTLVDSNRTMAAQFDYLQAMDLDVNIHAMRASIVEQRPLEDWLGDLSHDGVLGFVTDGAALRMQSISASRGPVTSFHTGNIVAGSLRFRDEPLPSLGTTRRIRYARAGQDVVPQNTTVEFNAGSGSPLERVAFFLRDKRSAQWVAEFYAKRDTPRTFTWTTALSPQSAPLEQFDYVSVTHPLLGSGTQTAEVLDTSWDGVRVTVTARQVPTGLFDFTSSVAPDLNFAVSEQFIPLGVTSWTITTSGSSFTYTHSMFTAPTHAKQFLLIDLGGPSAFTSSLSTATDSNVTIFVANSSGFDIPNFQLWMKGWQLDTY